MYPSRCATKPLACATLIFLSCLVERKTVKDLRTLFEMYESKKSSGCILRDGFDRMLRDFGMTRGILSDSTFKTLDTANDGYLDHREFTSFVLKCDLVYFSLLVVCSQSS